jgi:uncharacterized protein with NRDE domain
MCLAIVALRAHPEYPLVIAANRDEFHARTALPATWWEFADTCLLAGRDRTGGGTWMGITRTGRWSLLTNYREGVARDPAAPSRGELVPQALRPELPPLASAARIAAGGAAYHGFNLLVGDADQTAYASNRASGARSLSDGIHTLSNHLLGTPWPKVIRTRERMHELLARPGDPVDGALALLADRTLAEDSALPSTGVSAEWERVLSAAFIVTPTYGTRCSTVVTIDSAGQACLVERSFDAGGEGVGEVRHAFAIERAVAPTSPQPLNAL